jgi:SH3-like domain-containing protein
MGLFYYGRKTNYCGCNTSSKTLILRSKSSMKKHWMRLLFITLVVLLTVPTSTALAQDGGQRAYQEGEVDTRSALAIRAEPDITAEVLTTVEDGVVVDVLEVDGIWALVRVDGVEGWTFTRDLIISLKMLDLQATLTSRSDIAIRSEADLSAPVVNTLPSGAVVGVLMVDGVWAYVYDGQHLGWVFTSRLTISDPDTSISFVRADATTRSTRSDIAVRSEPSLQGEALTTLATDVPVGVLAYSDNGLFAYIKYDGGYGWTFTRSLVISPLAVASGEINAGPANFRDAPNGAIFQRLPVGAFVYVLGRSENSEWVKIRYTGGDLYVNGENPPVIEGWVSTGLVTVSAGNSDVASYPVVE